MRVAVAGGTGLVGRYVVASLAAASHDPIVLSRSTGVDLVSGKGLQEALARVDAVIDVSNVTTMSREESVAFFGAATGNLLEIGQRAGVRHHVVLSIVGIDRVDLGYYEGKRRQEELVAASDVPSTVLRATQFHEFAGQVLARVRGPVAVIPQMRTQPIAAREVADALVALVDQKPTKTVLELAGPRVEKLTSMARRVLKSRHERRFVLPVWLPGSAGKAMRAGGLLPTEAGPRGKQTFAQWLAESSETKR